ncbi:phosphomannomutase/phosphoglucomutase [Desulfotomaculum defluvii]
MTKIKVNPFIFREYDIRGKANSDFPDKTVELLGLSLGTYFQQRAERDVVVCHDNRASSPRLNLALNKGLLASGCNVIDIGENPTPVSYFALKNLGKTAGVMITGSHNPPEDNGFKISSGGNTIYGEEIQKIKGIMEAGPYTKGLSQLVSQRIKESYVRYIADQIKLKRPLKLVVDAGNGTTGSLALDLYRRLGCQVIGLYCESDNTFPVHHPDPTVPENLRDLQQLVLQERYDLGLAFDGDGDRLGVVDERGNIIWGDILQILFWREILPQNPGTPVIVEVKCSQALVEEAKRLGGKPFFYKTGHSLIKAKMKEVGALFTGEMSGHLFFADEYFGYDDALYAGARLLRLISQSKQSLSQLLSDIPNYVSTPEIRMVCPDNVKKELIQQVKLKMVNEGYKVIDVDGVRVLLPDGWGLLRCSNTQPVVVMRAEARDEQSLDHIVKLLKSAFHETLAKFVC